MFQLLISLFINRIGTYKIKKISLSYFNDKIHIQNNGYDEFSWTLELILKNSYLNNYSKKLFCQAYYFHFQSNQDSFFIKNILFNFQSNQNSFFIKHIKFQNRKELKKMISEELMAKAWHPNIW